VQGRWTNLLLVTLLLGQLVLLSSRQQARDSPLERLALAGLAPVAHGIAAADSSLGGFFDSFSTRASLRAENALLHQQLDRTRRDLMRLQGLEEELRRLKSSTGYARRLPTGYFVADVVYIDYKSWLQSMVLYTGTAELRKNQPVVSGEGLVGRIVLAAGRYAKVQLMTDRSSSVSAMIRRTRRQGIVQGDGKQGLDMLYMPLQSDVREGDEVVTAGMDGIFPRGIPIGKVASVKPGSDLFHHIRIHPAIDFMLLDQVDVVALESVPTAIKEALSGAVP